MVRSHGARAASGPILLMLALSPAVAAAQEAPAQERGSHGGGAEDLASRGDAEILVTARKRAESLAEVPAAITVLGKEERELLVIDDADDILRQVPSATLVTSGPEYLNDITIRGQGGGRLGFSETATGIFRDGLFSAGGGFGGRSLSRMDLFDMERIEIL
ncbi:MAG TPA: Plug domain-containing protein, partial [Sphingopyxis sp.]|nr:Plug domain-containing protein [Sphingopyxis sp.]